MTTTDAQVDELVERLRVRFQYELEAQRPAIAWMIHDAAARIAADRKRIEELEAALRQIDAHNDNPARFSGDIDAVIRRALEGTTNG